MTAHDILKIAVHVTITQCMCDLLSRYFVYNSDPYQKLQSSFQRAKTKRDKALASAPATITSNSASKKDKKLQRFEDEVNTLSAEVAKRHVTPSFLTSIIFLILYRVLSAEYSGKVIAVLPFEPHWLIQKITSRGIKFDMDLLQENTEETTVIACTACSFAFIYLLCTMSCKFMASKIFSYDSPTDAGMGSFLDAPQSQKVLKSFGVDKDELGEARKILGY